MFSSRTLKERLISANILLAFLHLSELCLSKLGLSSAVTPMSVSCEAIDACHHHHHHHHHHQQQQQQQQQQHQQQHHPSAWLPLHDPQIVSASAVTACRRGSWPYPVIIINTLGAEIFKFGKALKKSTRGSIWCVWEQ